MPGRPTHFAQCEGRDMTAAEQLRAKAKMRKITVHALIVLLTGLAVWGPSRTRNTT